ncbi:MAG: hypothetical protein HZA50_12400 [Planctomycetes bacterium]|nr:hypothetical protein [Planctomycetota bacterium]
MNIGPEKPVWPLVIGIICVAFAGIGMLCTLTALITIAAKIDRGSAYKTFPSWYSSFEVVTFFVSFFLAVFLLAGGIMLVKRIRESTSILKAYSIVNLLSTCVSYASMLFGDVADKAPYEQKIILYMSWAIGLPLSFALPVFLLIWLLRAKVKQDMLDWK